MYTYITVDLQMTGLKSIM